MNQFSDTLFTSQEQEQMKMTSKWIDTVEVAKLIRKELAVKFPGIKFSVKSSRYAGGSSIHVEYSDGPKSSEVEAVVDFFQGADFDGMTDMKTHRGEVQYNGETVKFGVDYTFVNRHMSEATMRMFAEMVGKKYGVTPAYKQGYEGKWYVEDIWDDKFPGMSINTVMHREFCLWDVKDGAIESIADLPSEKEATQRHEEYEAWLAGQPQQKEEVVLLPELPVDLPIEPVNVANLETVKQLPTMHKLESITVHWSESGLVNDEPVVAAEVVQEQPKPKQKRTRKPRQQKPLTIKEKVCNWLILKLGGKLA